jgi:hypothetical protein
MGTMPSTATLVFASFTEVLKFLALHPIETKRNRLQATNFRVFMGTPSFSVGE